MRYFAAILVTAVIAACGKSNYAIDMNDWTYDKISVESLEPLNLDELSPRLIERVQQDYRLKPVDPSYAELELSSAYLDPSRSATLLIFDIRHVEDIQAVYLVGADGRIEEKFLLSAW